MVIRVAIVGCGLIGNRRAKALGPHTLVAVADSNLDRARDLASRYPACVASDRWESVVCRDDVDAVVVATSNNVLVPATLAAIRAGKHVLVEKPAARSADELLPVLSVARSHNAIVKVGFNHRLHPAFRKAKQIFDSNDLGPLMYIRARYGHGGRRGMEKEWRGFRATAGGGEMLDQGVHLIDLARWFAGDFVSVTGHVARYFWDWEVEDNGFALLKTATGQTASIHASCTEWKNLFSFEIFCRDGKLHIDGLGGSYGVERLACYKMRPEMGPPDTTIWEYPGEDASWRDEWTHFVSCIQNHQVPDGSLDDALAALTIIKELYRLSATDEPASGGSK